VSSAEPPFLESLPLTRRAFAFARDLHADQRRDWDGAPFILHPLEVAALLSTAGWPDEVVAAGILHDIVEDTDVDVATVGERFGEPVAALVAAVTEDPDIEPYEARKEALRRAAVAAGPEARAIFAADKLAKARDLRAQIAHAPDQDPSRARRLAHYQESLRLLCEHEPDQPLVRQLGFELWALRNLPPGA
jgi:(p)ppGpp synthase/HD superfamily hydrolase